MAWSLLGLVVAASWAERPAFGQAQSQFEELPGWRLVFNDEFEGDALDAKKWKALDRRDSFNNEKQYYHPDQVVVSEGQLHLTAINEPRDGKEFQSGIITSHDIFGPGRFEARIDLPTSQGMWPAFWLNANQVQWPLGGEIDIMENRGSEPLIVSSAYHWQAEPGPCCDDHEYVFENHSATGRDRKPVNFHEGFNTYTAVWDERVIRFFVNGDLHFKVTRKRGRPIFDTPKNIIVNLAVGGDFGGDPDDTTVWPQTMHVDYVRVWRRESEPSSGYNADGSAPAIPQGANLDPKERLLKR